jgi:hypothetical protein
MSKFLLNLLLQISKALVYSKIKFLFEKEFSFTFGPIGPAASQPSCGPLVFFSIGRSPSPPWASAPRPAQLAVSAQPTERRWRPARMPPPIRESVFLENCLPFTNAYSTENLPPPLGPYQPAWPHPPPPALACRPAQTAQPTWPLSRSARAYLWRILQKTFSSLIHAFCSRRFLSLPSLTHGPRLSALSSTLRWPTPIAPPPSPATSDLSAPPVRTSRCRPKPLLAPPSLPPLQVAP